MTEEDECRRIKRIREACYQGGDTATHEDRMTTPTDGDLIRRGDALAIFQPENSMIRRRICDDIRALAVQPAPVAGMVLPLMPEVLAALDATGCNVSLARDLRAALAVQPAPVAHDEVTGYRGTRDQLCNALGEMLAREARPIEKVIIREAIAQLRTQPAPVAAEPAEEWEDRPDDLSEAVRAAHPCITKDYATYSRAMELVGNRHSKGALVNLVCYLLREAARPASEIAAEAVAGAYAAAAEMIEDNVSHAKKLGREIWPMPDLRTLTPIDAADALDRRDAATREAALREAADLADTTFSGSGTDAARIIRHAILAKIGGAK